MRGSQHKSHVTSPTNSSQNSSCLLFILLSEAESQEQRSKQRCPDFPHPGHFPQEDLLRGLLVVGHAWNMPEGVQRRSSASSSPVTEHLTLSLRDRPAALQQKLIPAAYIHHHVHSVPPQSSSPGIAWRF